MTTTTPLITIASNGYALITETPTGLIATLLTPEQAEAHFDSGTNYEPEVDGEYAEAVSKAL